MKANIIIVGVGGQGILLTSKILGYLALKMGDDVKVSEVHGMSQRGGSVITHVRIGENVPSPLVTPGEADMVIAFEWLEALRSEFYLRQGGAMIANTHRMLPMPVIMGKAAYPEQTIDGHPLYALDAQELAERCGSVRAVNIVLLGVLSQLLPWPAEAYEEAVAACVKPATLAVNLAAFRAGRAAYQNIAKNEKA